MSQSFAALKTVASIFTLGVICDNVIEMESNTPAFDPEHPLLTDRERLNRILDIMYAKIQKTLFSRNVRRRNAEKTEQVLYGTGVSADDVLAEAQAGLLQCAPEQLKGTWEGVAVGIAYNKAVDALRACQRGLGGTKHRPQLRLVSGDAKGEGSGGESQPALFEVLRSNWGDPEAEYLKLECALKLRNLAREVLKERARKIFFAIHFDGDSRTEIGEQVGLTSQRVGQIYRDALRVLETHPDYPFKLDS